MYVIEDHKKIFRSGWGRSATEHVFAVMYWWKDGTGH